MNEAHTPETLQALETIRNTTAKAIYTSRAQVIRRHTRLVHALNLTDDMARLQTILDRIHKLEYIIASGWLGEAELRALRP